MIVKLEGLDYYQELFSLAFGDPQITEQRMQLALAQFIRSIQSFDTKYDAGRSIVNNDNQNFPNFTQLENLGKQLFMENPQFDNQGQRTGGGLGCDACHLAPEFDIRPGSDNNGVVGSINGGSDFDVTRSPTLRDVMRSDGAPNGQFMHTGEFSTFEQVLNHYANIPAGNIPNLDNRLRPQGNPQRLNLTNEERQAVTAFMRTLSGSDVYTNEKWSDPFLR